MPTATRNKTILTKFLNSDLQLNQDERTVGFSFSSKDNICERYSLSENLPEGASVVFDERLSHDPNHWDLTRVANKTCPFLRNHQRGQKLGMVSQVVLDGDRGVATVKLSRNALANQFISDLEDGTSGGISFGYFVEEYRVITPAEYVVSKDGYRSLKTKALLEATKIVLFEVSAEDIPADPTVGYGKSEVFFDQVSVKGDPNFYPMNKDLEAELLATKTALEEVKSSNSILSEKQALLVTENNRLTEQIKSLSQSIEEKTAIISAFEQREAIVSQYYNLRQKADGLVSEGKLSSVEFSDLFLENITEDINKHLKSNKLGYMEFHLDLIEKRTAPLLNLKQSISEPVTNPNPTANAADIESRAARIVGSLSQIRSEI